MNPNIRGNINPHQQNIYRPTIPNPAAIAITNKYNPRSKASSNPKSTSDSSPSGEIIDDALPTSPSSSTAQNINSQTKAQNKHFKVQMSAQTTQAESPRIINPQFLERQFGFSRPTSTQIKAQIEEVKQKFDEYSISDCRDKVNWLATIVLQQQLDLDLLRSTALSVEDWTSEELKQLGKIRKEYSCLAKRKKQLEELNKKNGREKADLEAKKSTEKAEFEAKIDTLETEIGQKTTKFEQAKNSLEKEVQELKPYKEKCKRLTLEAETLRAENEEMKKRLDQLVGERERYGKMVDPIKLEEAQRERDDARQKCGEMAKERLQLKSRVGDLEKKLIAEMKKKQEQGERSTSPAEENIDHSKEGTQRQAKLASKDAEIDKLKEALEAKTTELESGRSQAKHKVMELREKLRRKREENEKAEMERKKEQERRETAELEAEKCNKELAKMRRKMEEMRQEKGEEEKEKDKDKEPKNVAEMTTIITTVKPDNKLPMDEFKERLQEIEAKKAEMEKALLAMTTKEKSAGIGNQKCENCAQLEGYLNRAQQRNDEMTAIVFSKEIEIVDLRAKVKEKEKNNGNNLLGMVQGNNGHGHQQPQHQRMLAPPEMQQQQQNGVQIPLSKGQKRKAAGETEKGQNEAATNKRQKSNSSAIVLIDVESEEAEKQREKSANLNVVTSKSAEVPPPTPAASSISLPASNLDNSSIPPTISKSTPSSVQQTSNLSGRSTSQPKPLTTTAAQSTPNPPDKIPSNSSRPSSVPNQTGEAINAAPMTAQIIPCIPPQPRVQSPSSPQQNLPPRPQIRPQPFAANLNSLLQQPPQIAEQQPMNRPPEGNQPAQGPQNDGGENQQDQYKQMAARIVTQFLFFIGLPENIQRDARALIQDFIRRSNLPQNPSIVNQLAIIADEAERQKRNGPG